MKIKLIQPLMHRRPMDTDLKTRMSPPLGLLTIASMLRHTHEVTIENENVRPLNLDDTPHIVGISVYIDSLPRAIELARIYRAKGAKVIAGGILVTTAFDFVPQHEFDALCIGAAEGTWHNIVHDVENNCLQKVYRCSHSFTGNQIISPAYDMINSCDYLYCNIIHTSRGCPFRCDFCYNSSKERFYVNRPVADVIAEIKAIKRKHIMFIDDNFVGNPSWTRALLKELKPLKIKWNAAASINVVNIPGLLDEMKEAGCQGLFIGFESISPDSVGSVHKVQNNVAKYEYAIDQIHKRGIMINASFVFGLDSDTPETFSRTLQWIVKNRIETVTSHILTPFPGTIVYDQMKAEGRLLTENLALFDTAHVVFKPKGMTADQLYNGYLQIYKDIYSFKNIWRRMPRCKAQIPAYLMFNLFYRKWGRFTDWLCRKFTYERIGKYAEKLSKYI